jgi:hypothetical protein
MQCPSETRAKRAIWDYQLVGSQLQKCTINRNSPLSTNGWRRAWEGGLAVDIDTFFNSRSGPSHRFRCHLRRCFPSVSNCRTVGAVHSRKAVSASCSGSRSPWSTSRRIINASVFLTLALSLLRFGTNWQSLSNAAPIRSTVLEL